MSSTRIASLMLDRHLLRRYSGYFLSALFVLSSIATVLFSSVLPATSQQSANTVEIAAALSLTGDSYTFGRGSLEGIQLAIEEANATGIGPRITFTLLPNRTGKREGDGCCLSRAIRCCPADINQRAWQVGSLQALEEFETAICS